MTIAVIAALGVGAFAISIFPGAGTGTSTPNGETNTMVTTFQGSTTSPLPSSYSILGQEPFLMVSPKNHTFIVPFDVVTRNYSISLTYSPADSHAWLFSNGTQWASSTRACPAATTTTLTSSGTYTTTVTGTSSPSSTTGSPPILTHISQVPCGDSPPGEWWALNGTLISRNVPISSNDVQMAVAPSIIPPHFTGKLNVILTITMPPGNYGVFLAVHVSEPDNPSYGTSLLYIIYYMPVVVQSS